MQNINKFQKVFKLNFKNKFLLVEAFTHKSANQKINNEKLEFLGDRVIGLILSKKLFDLYPKESEGVLDKKFANLVNKKTCCEVAWSIRIQDFIILGNKKKKVYKSDEKILSDCCEALIGAIFIDHGYLFVKDFVLKIWKHQIDKSNITILDSKTKLQEHSLKKFKELPIYKLSNTSGPKHNPTYKISVTIKGSKKSLGEGNSKQQAQQDAARKLLKTLNIK
jgi:ribonuclease III